MALLPTYDSMNIRCWVSVGSSINGAVPTMAHSPWPGGFFSFMFFVPLHFAYLSSGFNLYFSVVTLKVILFFFTLLTALLLYRIAQKIKPAYAEAVLLFTLLNPAVLYVNYFWAQVDILPVFFFVLGYTLLRNVDFGGNNQKRYFIALLPIVISAFIYRYTLILIPTLLFFDAASLRSKLSGFAIAVGMVAVFFGFEFMFFRGGFYDFLGALSGSVIDNSAWEGFQYWMQLPQLPYLALLVTLAVAAPLLFKHMRLDESAVLFFVLLLFIYTAMVQLPDYYLWLYPLGVLLALTATSRRQFNRWLLLTNLPIFVGLFFISFIIGTGEQAGIFYFTYPMLQQNIVFFSTWETYSAWLWVFNVFLLASVAAAAAYCLAKSPRTGAPPSDPPRLWRWPKRLNAKMSALLTAAVLLLLGLGFVFDASYAEPIVASDSAVFPLGIFPPSDTYDSSPMFSTYYLAWAGKVGFNDWSRPIAFNHSLSQQNLNLDLSFDLQTNYYGSYPLLKADNLTVGVSVAPRLQLSDLTAATVVSSSSAPSSHELSLLDSPVPIYPVGAGTYINYNLNGSSTGETYVLAFKLQNASSTERIMLYFRNPQCLLQLSLSGSHATLSSYDFAAQSVTSASTTYSRLEGYNLLKFTPAFNGLYCWINNQSLSLPGGFFRSETTSLTVTSAEGQEDFWLGGNVTQLYSGPSKPDESSRVFFVEDDSGSGFSAALGSGSINFSFIGTAQNCTVTYQKHTYTSAGADWVAFGKLSSGVYGFSLQLNQLALSARGEGYYLLPVYFAALVPFAVALLSLPLIRKKPV
ncbi:MAG: hypothetical protein NWE93_14585 [Candidatus Bathyarchaeota archaeon]|nr:hypothetical protein [Candidatus Bathyarchaeota archaeon]